MVEMVPKTIFRARKSFSKAFLSRNQSHGRNGAKNDFQGAKIIFKGFFCLETKAIVETVPKTIFRARKSFSKAVLFRCQIIAGKLGCSGVGRSSQHCKPGTIVQRCWPGDNPAACSFAAAQRGRVDFWSCKFKIWCDQ